MRNRIPVDSFQIESAPVDVVIEPEKVVYDVLSETERAKGFVNQVRDIYVHEKCGGGTRIDIAIAETYAREPGFYLNAYCVQCDGHFPVGDRGEFIWAGTDLKVGT